MDSLKFLKLKVKENDNSLWVEFYFSLPPVNEEDGYDVLFKLRILTKKYYQDYVIKSEETLEKYKAGLVMDVDEKGYISFTHKEGHPTFYENYIYGIKENEMQCSELRNTGVFKFVEYVEKNEVTSGALAMLKAYEGKEYPTNTSEEKHQAEIASQEVSTLLKTLNMWWY